MPLILNLPWDSTNRGVSNVLNSIVFNMLPIVLEVTMVTGLLAYSCGAVFAGTTLATIAGYTAFTFGVTQWRCVVVYPSFCVEGRAVNLFSTNTEPGFVKR